MHTAILLHVKSRLYELAVPFLIKHVVSQTFDIAATGMQMGKLCYLYSLQVGCT